MKEKATKNQQFGRDLLIRERKMCFFNKIIRFFELYILPLQAEIYFSEVPSARRRP
jgi:hypothetical protein